MQPQAEEVPQNHSVDFYEESDNWRQVYSVRNYKHADPIPGTYYQVSSGEWLINSNAGVHHYTYTSGGGELEQRSGPGTKLFITSVDHGCGSNVSYVSVKHE